MATGPQLTVKTRIEERIHIGELALQGYDPPIHFGRLRGICSGTSEASRIAAATPGALAPKVHNSSHGSALNSCEFSSAPQTKFGVVTIATLYRKWTRAVISQTISAR